MDVCASFAWWVACNIGWQAYRYMHNRIILIHNRRLKRARLEKEIELLKKEIKKTYCGKSMGIGDNK